MERAAQILDDVKGSERQTAVLMIDVDHFKRFNDSHGHLAGDRVLRGIGHILKQHVREGDIAARFGGEEFVVMLQAADGETAERVAERIRLAIRESDFDGVLLRSSPRVTASAGVAVFPEDGLELGDLIGSADKALYEAKEAGRDAVRRYGQATEDEEREGSSVEDSVAPALAPANPEGEDDQEALEIPVEEEPPPTPDEQRALDILDALTGAIPVGYDDEENPDEEPEEEEPAPLGATIYEMTRDASEAS